jgi:ligand-binding SRPBCC domain-containing protein
MPHHFETSQWLPYPPELVFAFFANPENLPRLMPHWQRARIEEAVFAPPPPRPPNCSRYPGIAAGDGTHLTISFRPFPFAPFRIPWEAQIEDFRWNQGFCDIQLRGPFTSWRHCHTVTAAPSPQDPNQLGTTLHDAVTYGLPLSFLTGIPARTVLTRIFRHRHERTTHLLALVTGRKQ